MLFPIIDGHNDVLMHLSSLEPNGRDFFLRSDVGHLDFIRAKEGGFAGGFFAIFIPNPSNANRFNQINAEYAYKKTIDAIGFLNELEAKSERRLELIRDASHLASCIDKETLAAILHIEGACAIDPNLSTLDEFYEMGVRSLGIVWSRPNAFGFGIDANNYSFPGSPDDGPGITNAGRKLIRKCNRLGIMLDVSHINERGFWDVARTSDAPLVATHSNVHALCPSIRNLTDKQLDAIAKSGGVVGVSFSVSFLREDGENNPDTPISQIVKHINYIVKRIGIDYVAFGSDFDGAMIPNELGDVTGLPKLINALRESGYSNDELEKIANKNWLRVLGNTWR